MRNDYDLGLDTELKKSVSVKMPSATSIVILGIVAIAAVVSLGEFSITLGGVVNVTATVAILYLVASILYSNSYLNGITKGKNTEEYIKAKAAHDEAVTKINTLGMLPKMPELCIKFCEEELKCSRTSIMLDACIKYDYYLKNYFGKSKVDLRKMGIPDNAIRCITEANKLKAVNITPSRLMSSGEDSTIYERFASVLGIRRSMGIESKTRQRIDYSANMVSRIVTTILSGVVGINIVIEEFNLKTIALWAMKMLPLAIAALSGYNSGYRNVLDTLIPQLLRKTKIINTLIGWYEEDEKNVLSVPK